MYSDGTAWHQADFYLENDVLHRSIVICMMAQHRSVPLFLSSSYFSCSGTKVITVVSDVFEGAMIDPIVDAVFATQCVIIDRDGTSSLLVVSALASSDLVLVPLRAHRLMPRGQ